MKGRKALALLLALALCAGLTVPALAAPDQNATHEDFNDLMVGNPYTEDPNDHLWEWAWPTIDDGIRRGLFIGYTPYQDAEGNTITNFGPGDPVTEAVGLTLCARMVVDTDLRPTILADRLEQMREIIPGSADDPDDPNAPNVWFRKEAAVCLELGVVSEDELLALRRDNRLNKPMTKADFAVYLIRAMGLEDFAKGLDATSLPFTDEARITREYRPYVKLLHSYGVLTGDQSGNFNPNQSMNRAVCATMMSRAIENILEEREVSVELPRYTDYPYAAGTIKEVNMNADGVRMMTLTTLDGEVSYRIPANAHLYQNNMPARATDLKPGTFAKLRLSDAGEVVMVRLTPAGLLSPIQGRCGAVDENHVVVGGVSYAIDRFTQVAAGGKTGDRTVIDTLAGYETAELMVNSRKVVLSMILSGGTRQMDGILTNVNNTTVGDTVKTAITVTAFNGLPTTYNVTENVAVSLASRPTSLIKSFEGKHVVLRVADDDFSDLKSIDVDPDSQYVQGVLQAVSTTARPPKVEITRTSDPKRTPYEVDPDCAVTYEGKAILLKSVPTGTFITAKLEGAVITEMSAWTGLETVSGVLTGITYADPAILSVTAEDGSRSEYSVALADLSKVVILVGDRESDITSLHAGDGVVLTLRYHNITQIDVTPRAADVAGILSSITFNADGSAALAVRLADGTTKTYTAAANAAVTRDGNPVSMTELVGVVGQSVALVTTGDNASSIQITGAASAASDSVEGVILSKDDQARIATILIPDVTPGSTRPVNVHIASGVVITTTDGTTLHNISRLMAGDTIQVYGSYKADGTFEATLVVRK